MKIAITGGTGFIGSHLARDLTERGHQVVLIARGTDARQAELRRLPQVLFKPASITDVPQLGRAFIGCVAVAHCAGISREQGTQTYEQVHVEGTRCVVQAAQQAAVKKLVLVSYVHARPDGPSPYHTTKWQAEEIVRQSGLNYTILKAGLIYGFGDHLLDHLGHLLRVVPLFATVGVRERTVRPVAIADLVTILRATLLEARLSNATVAVLGPEELPLSVLVRRIARVLGKRVLVLPAPVLMHRLVAWASEQLLPVPLVTASQIHMLAEGISVPLSDSERLPDDLAPRTPFSDEQIRNGLPA